MSSFQALGVFLRQKPKGVKRMQCRTNHARNSFWLCQRDIVNEKPLNLEKTTSTV